MVYVVLGFNNNISTVIVNIGVGIEDKTVLLIFSNKKINIIMFDLYLTEYNVQYHIYHN